MMRNVLQVAREIDRYLRERPVFAVTEQPPDWEQHHEGDPCRYCGTNEHNEPSMFVSKCQNRIQAWCRAEEARKISTHEGRAKTLLREALPHLLASAV